MNGLKALHFQGAFGLDSGRNQWLERAMYFQHGGRADVTTRCNALKQDTVMILGVIDGRRCWRKGAAYLLPGAELIQDFVILGAGAAILYFKVRPRPRCVVAQAQQQQRFTIESAVVFLFTIKL